MKRLLSMMMLALVCAAQAQDGDFWLLYQSEECPFALPPDMNSLYFGRMTEDVQEWYEQKRPMSGKYPALVHLPSGLIEAIGTNTVEEAQSNLLERIAPTPMPFGIETPVVVIPSAVDGTPAYGIVVTDDGHLVTYEDHASPRVNRAERERRIGEAITNQSAIVDALKALKTEMTNNIAAAQAIDPSVFSGAQKTQIQAIRKGMIDHAQAINLMRRKLLKYFKVEEN